MVSDDPAKGLGRAAPEGNLCAASSRRIIGEPARELDLVSPYFVPATAGVEASSPPWPRRGVQGQRC